MSKQNFEMKNVQIRQQLDALKKTNPDRLKRRLNLAWSNWGFGLESLADSAKRLEKAGLSFIELHGNHYGPGLGYEPKGPWERPICGGGKNPIRLGAAIRHDLCAVDHATAEILVNEEGMKCAI